MTDAAAAPAVFATRVVAALIAAGVVLAIAFALLNAFETDLGSGRDGGSHALSVSATGFSGIVALARATGTPARIARDGGGGAGAGLLVLTPQAGGDAAQLARLVAQRADEGRGGAAVLIVLPKWQVEPQPLRPAWVRRIGLIDETVAVAPLAQVLGLRLMTDDGRRDGPLTDRAGRLPPVPAPMPLRSLDTAAIVPLLENRRGDTVLARHATRNLYILADPDLLANHRLRDPATARAALAMLRSLGGAREGGIVFDVTLNGFERSRNLLRLAFEPPFLTFTLTLLAVAALAGAQAAVRFGVPRATPRALAFGKRALVENAAELIRSARREAALTTRYADLMRDAAAARLHGPPGLDAAATAAWLDHRRTGEPFAALAARAAAADRRDTALAAAQALHQWKEDVVHDRR